MYHTINVGQLEMSTQSTYTTAPYVKKHPPPSFANLHTEGQNDQNVFSHKPCSGLMLNTQYQPNVSTQVSGAFRNPHLR